MAKQTKEDIAVAVQSIKPKSFHTLLREYSEIALELEEGEWTEELEDRLTCSKSDFEDKLVGMFYIIEANKGKIDSFYKPEIKAFTDKIRRLENNNDRLKKNMMMIVEMFGHENKIKTLALNCTKVDKEVLNISEGEFEERVRQLLQAIRYNNFESVTDNEQDCFKATFTFNNISMEEARKLYDLIRNDVDKETFPEPNITLSLDKNLALSRLKATNEFNKGLEVREAKSLFDDDRLTEEEAEEAKLDVGIKGISIDTTSYLRLS